MDLDELVDGARELVSDHEDELNETAAAAPGRGRRRAAGGADRAVTR